jgi:hypothetical protein
MKQKDIAVIIVIAFLSGIVSFLISNKIFVTAENRQQKVEVVDVISTEFNTPDDRFFNAESINPTLNSSLGDTTNQNPFNGSTQ